MGLSGLQVSLLVSFCSKDESAFMVNPLTAQGVAVVIVAYDIAPKGNKGVAAGEASGLCGRRAPMGADPACAPVQAPWTRWQTRWPAALPLSRSGIHAISGFRSSGWTTLGGRTVDPGPLGTAQLPLCPVEWKANWDPDALRKVNANSAV